MPRLKFPSLRARLLCWILCVTIPIFSASLFVSTRASDRWLVRDAERQADRLAAQLAADLDSVVRPIEGGTHTVAQALENVELTPQDLHDLARSIVLAWPDVYGSTIAMEDPAALTGQADFAPYYYRSQDTMRYADLASASYAYRQQPWYRLAANAGKPLWSAPYFDEGGGNIWMITYSVPFFRNTSAGERRLAGVVTADLALDWVRIAARSVEFDAGLGWLSANANDAFVVPVGAVSGPPDGGSTGDAARLRDSARAMLAAGSTFGRAPLDADETPAYLAARSLQTLDWQLTLWLPRKQLLGETRQLLAVQLSLGALGLALLVGAIVAVAARISRPITALAHSVRRAGEGDLQFALPESTRHDEIGTLTTALRRLRDSLSEHIQALAATLAERRRLEHELEFAAQIQQSMLPRVGRLGAPDQDIRIAAALVPAREVGGDLYDYFEVQERQVLFAIGDVSDKGVPAALFMARLSGLLRAVGVSGHPPERILSLLNSKLAESNDACMFVTAACGILDSRSGALRYASAGHDAPILRTARGAVAVLESEIGAAIGIEEQEEYRAREIYLAPGDTLVMFTDGVTEAEGSGDAPFGVARLIELMQGAQSGEVMALVKIIVDGVATHVGARPASDDLTILLMSYRPRDVSLHAEDPDRWTITIAPQRAAVAGVQLRLTGLLRARAVAEGRIDDAVLIVEELVVNALAAAERAAIEPRIELDVVIAHEAVVLTLSDGCPPFDPLQTADPQLDVPISERAVGGLGVFLVRRLADQCTYRFADGMNHFQARLHLEHTTVTSPGTRTP